MRPKEALRLEALFGGGYLTSSAIGPISSADPLHRRQLRYRAVRANVLIETEQIGRVVNVLQRNQPHVLLVAVSLADAVGLDGEVQVPGASAEGSHGPGEAPVGSDQSFVVTRLGPGRNRMEEIARVTISARLSDRGHLDPRRGRQLRRAAAPSPPPMPPASPTRWPAR